MANIVYRGAAAPTAANTAANKNAALTNDEIDKNFFALNDAAITIGTTPIKPSATSLTLAGLTSVTSARVLAGDGTAASPSIAFAGDGAIDTGFYWGGDGYTFFTNNGVKTGEIQPGGHLSMVGNVTVGGNLTVNGTTTTINATTITVDDINIELGSVATPTDTTANGGGITLKGAGDKTIIWDSSNANWTSNQDWNIATGKVFKINNVSVLSSTTLGTNVVNSSLTKLGTGAGFVKSDPSGNLTVDTNTYLTAESDTLATVTGRGATTATASTFSGGLTASGSTAFTLSNANNNYITTGTDANTFIQTRASTTASTGAMSLFTGDTTFATGTAGSVSIYPGSSSTATGANLSISGGNVTTATSTGGYVSIRGGVATTTATTAGTGGAVHIVGGYAYATSGTKVGGSVWINGGLPFQAGTNTGGNVNIGTGNANFNSTTTGTVAINIGTSTNTTTVNGTVKLPNVGTSGFVKLGTGGQLSQDTTAYLSGVVAIANGGTNITTYASGDILYASAANVLSKLAKGSDEQVLKLASGFPAWGTDNDTTYSLITEAEITAGTATDLRTISGARAKFIADRNVGTATPSAHGTAAVGTSLQYARQDHVHASDNTDTNTITTIKGGTGTAVSGAVEFAAGTNVSITQAGQVVTINSSYTDTNTTYSASTGLTLTGTAFSANYGTTSTTACAGNDARLSDSRAANGGTATNANNAYVGQTSNTTNYDYLLCLAAGVNQNIALKADGSGGPTYNPLRNALCLDGFAAHTWVYPALQLGRDWSIAQDAYGYSFAAGCKATTASAWTGTGSFGKAMRFTLDANYGTFYWYVKPTDTADTTTSISFRTAMSLDIDGNLNTFGTVSGSNLSGTNTGDETTATIKTKLGITTLSGSNTGDQTLPTTLPHNGTALSATTGTFTSKVNVSDGSAGSPSIAFTSDTGVDTGFYWSADGYTNFTNNGVYAGNMGPSGNFTTVGNITAYGTATAPSDIRLKTNITRIDNALDKVCQLGGYTFDRTDRVTARQTGVIAQEVQKVLPEAVIELEDENKTLTVAYGNMMGLMIEAIKELNAKVTDLQNQLANK
jgi:hypothetical protein